MESYLISQFLDTCGNSLEMGSIAVLESCSVEGDSFEKLKDISAVQVSKLVMLYEVQYLSPSQVNESLISNCKSPGLHVFKDGKEIQARGKSDCGLLRSFPI